MKKVISLTLVLALMLTVFAVSFSAGVSVSDKIDGEYVVKSISQAIAEAEAELGEEIPTQRIYFQMPDGKRGFAAQEDHTISVEEKDEEGNVIGYHDEVYIHAGDKVQNLYNEYNLVGDKHYPAIYWFAKGAVPATPEWDWVGYRMEIEDYDQGIYYADVPLDDYVAPVVLFNNGVDAGSNLERGEFAAQSNNTNVEGAYEGDITTMPEGSPDDGETFNGCIYIINPDAVGINDLSGAPEFGDEDPWWFFYYGNGCYGSYSEESDNFVSVADNCLNPDHFNSAGVHVGYQSGDHTHTPGDPVRENEVAASFKAPGSYDEVVYCAECGEEISRETKTIPQLTYEPNKIYFDANSTGWNLGKTKLCFYIYSLETGEYTGYGIGAKKTRGTLVDEANGIWEYDPIAAGLPLQDGEQYAVIFNAGSETYSLLMDTSCFGHLAYADPEHPLENPVDSSKTSLPAYWEGLDPAQYGPRLVISSTGNVVGTCIENGKTGESIFNAFITGTGKEGLDNARTYSTKTEQQMIDDIGIALDLTKQQVYDAFTTAGVETVWDYNVSTLPGSVVIPTEPPVHEHTPGQATRENVRVTHDATFYDEVVRCTVCGEEISRVPVESPIITHTLKFVAEVPATYDAVGTAAHYVCEVCGKLFSDATGLVEVQQADLVIPKLVRPTDPVVVTGIRGDADNSGYVDVIDVTVIQRALSNIIQADDAMRARGDVDGNKELESIDATLIQRYLVGLNPYNIGQPLS